LLNFLHGRFGFGFLALKFHNAFFWLCDQVFCNECILLAHCFCDIDAAVFVGTGHYSRVCIHFL
jgi:hypothetical protein